MGAVTFSSGRSGTEHVWVATEDMLRTVESIPGFDRTVRRDNAVLRPSAKWAVWTRDLAEVSDGELVIRDCEVMWQVPTKWPGGEGSDLRTMPTV